MPGGGSIETTISHSDPIAPVIFGVTLILAAALVGRYTARRLNQPSVLGELIMGVMLGNILYAFHYDLILVLREGSAALEMSELALSGISWEEAAEIVMGPAGAAFLDLMRGPNGGEYLKVVQAVDIFSRYGVIFLLFHVGLETCVKELRQVGGDSLRVAVIGVVAPFSLGYFAGWALDPGATYAQHMFLGATLSATSIGLTARVLGDLNRSASPESHVIIGAAVIDDILGLVILAIVSGVVVSGSIRLDETLRTVLLAVLFITSVLLLGRYIIQVLVRLLSRLDVMEAKLFISFIFVMTLAWFANLVGLATIVGAFAAGVMLLDSQFTAWGDHKGHKYSIRELFAPIEAIMVPIFFVLMGIQVKLETFADLDVLFMAVALIVVAIVGKLVAGAGAFGGLNRLAVGVGMMPRGEVGLVFAAIGKSLDVISSAMFSAVVLVVIVTTLVTPPLLKLTLGQGPPQVPGKEPPVSKLCD